MQKKLKSSGNGWELYLSKQLLKLLGYNPNEIRLLITSNNGALFIEPINIEETEKYKDYMVSKLQRSGGSGYGLYLPTPLIEVLNINPETDFLDIEILGNKFSIKKTNV